MAGLAKQGLARPLHAESQRTPAKPGACMLDPLKAGCFSSPVFLVVSVVLYPSALRRKVATRSSCMFRAEFSETFSGLRQQEKQCHDESPFPSHGKPHQQIQCEYSLAFKQLDPDLSALSHIAFIRLHFHAPDSLSNEANSSLLQQ